MIAPVNPEASSIVAPTEATAVFGANVALASRYAEILVTAGVERGLIGPREVDRIWPRHLVNCALVSELVPESARVLDVGSGAGLPGLVLAIARPDVAVTLLEPLQRRVDFLAETVVALGLSERVAVVHGRAEDPKIRESLGGSSWITARAVAPLDRLVKWCLPLLRPGGSLLAIKGSTAAAEINRHAAEMRRFGAESARVVRCGVGAVSEPTTVVVVRRAATRAPVRRGQQ